MKNRLDWLGYLLISVNILLVLALLIFLIYGLEPGYTGPIGDTFGGLLSPVIGIVSIIFIYKTFAAQREQLKDQRIVNAEQREQHHINRITDIAYKQLEKINETVKSQIFSLPEIYESEKNAQGYIGIHSFNDKFERLRIDYIYTKDEQLTKLIADNLRPLIEMYESLSSSVVIIDNLLTDSALNLSRRNDLRTLLMLNLGDSVRDNVFRLNEFMQSRTENYTELNPIWSFDKQVGHLNQLVSITHAFLEDIVSQAASVR